MRNFLLVIVILFSATACMVTYEEIEEFVFKNQSNHYIVITRGDDIELMDWKIWPETITLEPNKDIAFVVLSPEYCRAVVKATFDGNVVIDYTKVANVQYNIAYSNNYEFQIVDKEKFHRKYTYTFTDADYQYALENEQKLEY